MAIHGAKRRARFNPCRRNPSLKPRHRAGGGAGAANGNDRPPAVLIALGVPDGDAQALLRHGQIGQIEGDEFGAVSSPTCTIKPTPPIDPAPVAYWKVITDIAGNHATEIIIDEWQTRATLSITPVTEYGDLHADRTGKDINTRTRSWS
jgi:hypothetical protein